MKKRCKIYQFGVKEANNTFVFGDIWTLLSLIELEVKNTHKGLLVDSKDLEIYFEVYIYIGAFIN